MFICCSLMHLCAQFYNINSFPTKKNFQHHYLNRQIEKGLAFAIELLVEEFSSQKSLDLLVCAPDWRVEEKRHLRTHATGNGLRVVSENFQEDLILVVSHKQSLLEVSEKKAEFM